MMAWEEAKDATTPGAASSGPWNESSARQMAAYSNMGQENPGTKPYPDNTRDDMKQQRKRLVTQRNQLTQKIDLLGQLISLFDDN